MKTKLYAYFTCRDFILRNNLSFFFNYIFLRFAIDIILPWTKHSNF